MSTANISEKLAELCMKLCSIHSVTGKETEIADFIVDRIKKTSPETDIRRLGNSLVIGADFDSGKPVIALVGHLDTVPPIHEHSKPERKGDIITGLGSSDMKGGLAVALSLFEDLHDRNIPFDLMMVFYDCEEGPSLNSGLFTLLKEEKKLKKIDFAVVMEPTDGIVQIGCLGTLHASLSFRGKSAHSARPWHGKNAITKAGVFLTELENRKPEAIMVGGQVFKEVFTVTMAKGGRYPNIVPDTFTMNLNYRFAPGKSIETAKKDVLNLVDGRADIHFTDISPSGSIPWDNPLFQKLLDETGRNMAPKQAWTDVARLSEAGIDAINFGPGLAAQAHQANEYCTISGMKEVYENMLDFLCNPPDS